MSQEKTSSILDEIVAARRKALAEAKARAPLDRLMQEAETRTERRDFAAALAESSQESGRLRLRVIAELKRASPSRGLLRKEYRRREIALGYAAGGASALSVLTEEEFFLGSLRDLSEVRGAVELPVLRKDFILEPYQVYESVAAGADAILLIVAALPDAELRNLITLAKRLQLAALVEVHDQTELERALAAGASLVGVNNRNLKTLEVDLGTSFRLRPKIPSTCLAVSESGIRTSGNLLRLEEAGYDAVLIGERLMTQPDPGQALTSLLDGARREDAKATRKG